MFIDAAELNTENTVVAAVQYRTVNENSAQKRSVARRYSAMSFVMKPYYRVCSVLITALGRFCCRNKHNDDRISCDPKQNCDA